MDSPPQDILARFHRALVEEILRTRPVYLSEPFTVAEIYQNLVPYRTHRDRIGVEMNGDYEDVLLRLLAGEGEYLLLESDHARRKIEDELRSLNPNTGLYREYAAADVRLNPIRVPRDIGATDPVSPDEPVAVSAPSHGGDDFPASIEVEAPVAASGEPLRACLRCREPLPRRKMLNYCPFCGADLRSIPCPNCGEELESGWRFCGSCRTEVGGPD